MRFSARDHASMFNTLETWRQRAGARLADQLWPPCCVICRRPGLDRLDLCAACHAQLPSLTRKLGPDRYETLCEGCGRAGPGIGGEPCVDCRGRPPLFSRSLSLYRYEYPFDCLLHGVKYGRRREPCRVFGQLLAEAVTGDAERAGRLPECLLPVPSTRRRLHERGFNPAEDIADWCGASLGVPVLARQVRRVEDGGALAGQARAERQLGIRGAFMAGNGVADRHVAIIDDVLTSGATSGELAREVLDSGAREVELWTLARTEA